MPPLITRLVAAALLCIATWMPTISTPAGAAQAALYTLA